MRPKSKPALTIAALWLATLAIAYWLGSKRDGQEIDLAQPSGGRPSEMNPANGYRGLTDTSHGDGSRPLSSTSAGGGARRGGSERILHLLSGASGADLRRSEFRDLAEGLSLEEVVGIIDQIAGMDPGPAQRSAYTEVLARWAQLDPGAALDHVGNIEAPGLRREATINVLRHWAAANPAAALDFAANNPNSDLPGGSIAAVFRGIGHSPDTSAALDFLATLDGSGHDKYAEGAIRELFERNDVEVIEWTRSLPEGALRDRSIHALVDQWARYDPMAAKAWLEVNTSDSNRVGALAALGESWAKIDPQAAAAWAMEAEIGGGDTRRDDKVLAHVFRRWMEYDAAEAAGFLAQQEPNPELDGALEQYIQQIKNIDPDATMAWAESISDPKRRRNAILHVGKAWRGQDPQAWSSYVASSPDLSDKERDKLLGLDKNKDRERDKKKPRDRDKVRGS